LRRRLHGDDVRHAELLEGLGGDLRVARAQEDEAEAVGRPQLAVRIFVPAG
jgi:hypothetical protein